MSDELMTHRAEIKHLYVFCMHVDTFSCRDLYSHIHRPVIYQFHHISSKSRLASHPICQKLVAQRGLEQVLH